MDIREATIDAARALDSLLRERVEGQALVSLRDHALGTPLRRHESYVLLVEIVRGELRSNGDVSSLATSIGLPPMGAEVELVVTVYAETITIQPSWRKDLRMGPDEREAGVEFTLIPQEPGDVELRVEFFHGNRWLQKLKTSLVVVP